MKNFEKETYGERVADVYDNWYLDERNPDAAVQVLTELARGGRVLELGIGTGRISLPLMGAGVEVHGIDASPAMVEKLRAKGAESIPVTFGDFADVPVDGMFNVVFIAFNMLFALTTQEAQLRCFRNVAAHLDTHGVFVIEAFVPNVARFTRGQNVSTIDVQTDEVRMDVSLHDPVTQQVRSQHLVFAEGGVHLYPVVIRYVWPSELDLMARLAGLRLRDRWGGWNREPFTADSGNHVSVYERAVPR